MELPCSSHSIVSLKMKKDEFYIFFPSDSTITSDSTYLSDNYTGVVQFLFVSHRGGKIDLLSSFVRLFVFLFYFIF